MTRSQIPQHEQTAFSGGYQVLAMIAKSMGYHVTAQQLVHQMGQGRRNPSTEDLIRAAKLIGVRARLVSNPSQDKLASLPSRAMIKFKDGSWYRGRGRIGSSRCRGVDPFHRRRAWGLTRAPSCRRAGRPPRPTGWPPSRPG